MNTSELKQTLVARACSYELAQAIADEIDRLRAENERVYEEGVSRLIEAQKINNREIESIRAAVARRQAWIDGVMAQGIVGNHLVSGRTRNVIYRPAPFEDK